MTKVKWEEMFPDELLQVIREYPVCYCAYGLAEPHGSYNALGLDWIKAQSLVELAAETFGGTVAPPCAWHIQERPFFDWFAEKGVTQPLCSSIPEDLFLHLVLYHIRAIDARSFHVAILVTGHYGGLENDIRLLTEYYLKRTGSPLKIQAFADWELIRYKDYRGDHAGLVETSQLMYLRPELVDLSRTEKGATFNSWAGVVFPTKDGMMPTKELGEKIVQSQIMVLGETSRKLLADYKRQKCWTPPSLTETEDIWVRFERLTRRYWWSSMTLKEYKQHSRGKKLDFPGWTELGE